MSDSQWIWKSVLEPDFSNSLKIKPSSIDPDTSSAVFEGSSGTYNATLMHCECSQFQMRLKGKHPCKHIIALGAALGVFDRDTYAHRFEAKKLADQLAAAYGYFHLFNSPVMSDKEYDALKQAYHDELALCGPEAPADPNKLLSEVTTIETLL